MRRAVKSARLRLIFLGCVFFSSGDRTSIYPTHVALGAENAIKHGVTTESWGGRGDSWVAFPATSRSLALLLSCRYAPPQPKRLFCTVPGGGSALYQSGILHRDKASPSSAHAWPAR